VGLTTNLRMEYRLRLSHANEPTAFVRQVGTHCTYILILYYRLQEQTVKQNRVQPRDQPWCGAEGRSHLPPLLITVSNYTGNHKRHHTFWKNLTPVGLIKIVHLYFLFSPVFNQFFVNIEAEYCNWSHSMTHTFSRIPLDGGSAHCTGLLHQTNHSRETKILCPRRDSKLQSLQIFSRIPLDEGSAHCTGILHNTKHSRNTKLLCLRRDSKLQFQQASGCKLTRNARPPYWPTFLHSFRVTTVRTAGQTRSCFSQSHSIWLFKYGPQFSEICMKIGLECRQYSLLGPEICLTLQQYCRDVPSYGLVFYVIFFFISSSNTRTVVPSLRFQSFWILGVVVW
jgi:hypothetical protein